MSTATIRQRVSRLRQPRRAARLALALWIVWAIVVWNVVLDHEIVMGGRAYVHAAGLAGPGQRRFPRMDDFMRPAVARGLRLASASALAIVAAGVIGVRAASRISQTS